MTYIIISAHLNPHTVSCISWISILANHQWLLSDHLFIWCTLPAQVSVSCFLPLTWEAVSVLNHTLIPLNGKHTLFKNHSCFCAYMCRCKHTRTCHTCSCDAGQKLLPSVIWISTKRLNMSDHLPQHSRVRSNWMDAPSEAHLFLSLFSPLHTSALCSLEAYSHTNTHTRTHYCHLGKNTD